MGSMQQLKKIPAVGKGLSWFYGLSQRDQTALKWMVLVVAAFSVYMFVWAPVQDFVESSKNSAEASHESLTWMKENEARARASSRQGGSGKGSISGGQSLLSTVGSSARKFGLELQRFEPRGEDKVNVWLDKVSFNQLMLWLGELEKNYGVAVEQITVDKADAPGVVSSRLSLSI
ncbi:type II secretion system protein M [Hahella sp. KA22]|nr:type II secretion system protein M [Hahella sp. KA22]QAY55399.1 type II secretion system protein M [Hahella sp. KA22]